MKKYLLIFVCILYSFNSFAQKQDATARFIVTDAKINGQDVTPAVVSQMGIYTVFYTPKGGSLCMANVCSKIDSQSYGPIYDFNQEHQDETNNTYRSDIFSFRWNYANTYDNKTGTCSVQFVKIYKPQGIVTILKIIQENLDVTEYTGYMEGSIDFSNIQ